MYSCKSLITTENEVAANEKRLSICLRSNGFSFSEKTSSGILLTFGEAEGEHSSSMTETMNSLKAFFASISIRPLGYASMQLVVISDASTWVPNELYSAAANRQYLKFVGCDTTSILAAPCKELASTAVFAADDALTTAFKVALPGLSVVNQHLRLTAPAICVRSQEHPMLLVHWRETAIDFAAYRDGRYLCGNTIVCSNDNEVLFHTVELIKTYNLDTPGLELLLCGDIDRNRFSLLRPYAPQTTLFTGTHSSYLNPAFKSLHTYRNALIL